MRIAFKEWMIVVDALGRGEQIIILRKGGISEGHGGFKVEHSRFLLFPTLFHQQRESVVPSAQSRFDEMAPSFPAQDFLCESSCFATSPRGSDWTFSLRRNGSTANTFGA